MRKFWKQTPGLGLLIIAAFVGSGISFGKLYLFHLALPWALWETRRFWTKETLSNPVFIAIQLFYALVAATTLIINQNFQFLFYYACSWGLFMALYGHHQQLNTNWKTIVRMLSILIIINCGIGLLEVISDFRYPISYLSKINHWFGRESFENLNAECVHQGYLFSMPAGFHWNANNFSMVLILGLIALPWSLSKWKAIFMIAVPALTLAAGSRLGFYLASAVIIALVINDRKFGWHWITLPLIAFVLTDGFYAFPTQNRKVAEVALVSQSQFDDPILAHCKTHLGSSDSRMTLTKIGLQQLKESNGMGAGAGGFTDYLNRVHQELKLKTYSPHNFLLELLVDFGIWILAPLLLLAVFLFRLYRKSNLADKWATLLFVIALPLLLLMPSSTVYFLPFYLFAFLWIIRLLNASSKA